MILREKRFKENIDLTKERFGNRMVWKNNSMKGKWFKGKKIWREKDLNRERLNEKGLKK